MKPDRRLTQSFILIAFFCAISLTSFSQVQELIPTDTASSSSELTEVISTDNEEKDTKILINNEKDSVSKVNVSKAKINPDNGRSEKVKEESEEEDSILSFNFIYYIFKRFKLSDIID